MSIGIKSYYSEINSYMSNRNKFDTKGQGRESSVEKDSSVEPKSGKNDTFVNDTIMSEKSDELRNFSVGNSAVPFMLADIDNGDSSDDFTAEMSKQLLGGILKRIEMMQSDRYTGKSWSKLMKAYGGAMAVFLREPPSEKDLIRAYKSILRDFLSLQKAEDDESPIREKLPLVLRSDTFFDNGKGVSFGVDDVGSVDLLKVRV